jgi:hypothetical protein
LFFNSRNGLTEILIHPVSTVSDLAGTILSCLPDAAALFAAANGDAAVPVSGVTVCGNVSEAVRQAVRQRRRPVQPLLHHPVAASAVKEDSICDLRFTVPGHSVLPASRFVAYFCACNISTMLSKGKED